MKNVLVTDGKHIKEAVSYALKEHALTNCDKIFVENKDTSSCGDLLSVFNKVEENESIEKTKAPVVLSYIISKCIFTYGNDEAITLHLFLEEEPLFFIKESIRNGLIFVTPNIFIKERNIFKKDEEKVPKNDEQKEKVISIKEKDNEEPSELKESNLPASPSKEESSEVNDERLGAILSLTRGISFEREGIRFSKEQNDALLKIFNSEENFTALEISQATGLKTATIYNRKHVLLTDNSTNEENSSEVTTKKRSERKKDAATVAREERNNELMSLASSFKSVVGDVENKLNPEVKENLKKYFLNSKRNWTVPEICKATNLKKSLVLNIVNDVKDEILVKEEDPKYTVDDSFFLYDFADAESVLPEMGSLNIFPSGNIIEDAENAIGKELSEADKETLKEAFKNPLDNEFDSDVMVVLDKRSFSHMDKFMELQTIFRIFKTLKMKKTA